MSCAAVSLAQHGARWRSGTREDGVLQCLQGTPTLPVSGGAAGKWAYEFHYADAQLEGQTQACGGDERCALQRRILASKWSQ